MIGGDASVGRSLATEKFPLRAPSQYYSAFSHTDFDITDKLTATFEASYSRVKGGPTGGSAAGDINTLVIQRENAYLAPAMLGAMTTAGVTNFTMSRYNREVGPIVATSDNTTVRGMFGLKGELSEKWAWDAYYQYGETKGKAFIKNDRNLTKWYQALDAVMVNGKIVCAATQPNGTIATRVDGASVTLNRFNAAAAGCIPNNLFGAGNANPDAIKWAVGTAWQTRKITQESAALNVRGDLVDLWGAGPISSAFGVEYRKDHAEGDADLLSQAGTWQTQAGNVLGNTGQDVKEAYAEFNIPLLKDMAFAKSLEFDAAGRYTDYSLAGAARTWKLGLVYKPDDQVMVRVTRSSDIRAPSAAELNPVSTRTFLNVNDGARGFYFVDIFLGGNPNLKLERADTTTYGFVLEPSFIPNFRFSADYYDISVAGAVDILTGQQTVNACAGGNAFVCGLITRNGAGAITSINARYQNLNALVSKGVEIVADYTIDMDKISSGLKSTLDLSLSATFTDDLSTTDAFGVTTQYTGWTGNPGTIQNFFGVPKWRYNVLATYSDGPWSASLNGRYVGPGVYDPTKIGPGQAGYSPTLPNSIDYNHVESRFYVDLTGKLNVTENMQLFGSVVNVADKDPPRLRLYGNPVLFDGIGRRFTVGVRANW
jgi:outer membrane receptor protein involved in Fe transport